MWLYQDNTRDPCDDVLSLDWVDVNIVVVARPQRDVTAVTGGTRVMVHWISLHYFLQLYVNL